MIINMNTIVFYIDIMTDAIAPPDTTIFGDQERPKRIFKIIVIGDSHVGMSVANLKEMIDYLQSLSFYFR